MAEMSFLEKIFVNSIFLDLLHNYIVMPSFSRFIGNVEGKVLEIGCGKGTTTLEIATNNPRAKITAIDYDEDQIKLAIKKSPFNKIENISFEQGDATKLRFKSSSFAYVFELNAFHHIKNYEKAMDEVYRVLKKDGKFFVMDMRVPFWIYGEAYFTRKKFEEKLEDKGFTVEKSKGIWWFYIKARKA